MSVTKTSLASVLALIKAADAVTDAADKAGQKDSALWEASKAIFKEFGDGGESAFNTAIIGRRIKRGLIAADGWKTVQTKDANGNDTYVFQKTAMQDVPVALRMRKLPDGAVINYTPDKGDNTANTYKGVIVRAIKAKDEAGNAIDWQNMSYSTLVKLLAKERKPSAPPAAPKSAFQRCNEAFAELERCGPEVTDAAELLELARRARQLLAMIGAEAEQADDEEVTALPEMVPPTATPARKGASSRKAAAKH